MFEKLFTSIKPQSENDFFQTELTPARSYDNEDIIFSSANSAVAKDIRSKINQLAILPNTCHYDVGVLNSHFTTDLFENISSHGQALHIHVGPELITSFVPVSQSVVVVSNANLSSAHSNLIALGHQRQLRVAEFAKDASKYQQLSGKLSLGQVRHHVHAVEPLLRNAEVVQFDMASIRSYESGGESRSLPTGLYTEEACQLMRYIGEGQKLKFVHIRTEDRSDPVKAMLIAQMLWYLLEGRSVMNKNSPEVDKSKFDSYIVGIDKSSISLTFYKDKSNNKWWAALENSSSYVPCSYEDYKGAVEGDISNNLILLL